MSVYDTEGNKDHISIRDKVFNYWKPHQNIHLVEKKQVLIIKKWKETSTYWKLKNKNFKLF